MGWCNDAWDERRDGERDARRGYPDRERYDHYADYGSCEREYSDAYDSEKRRIEYRREEERQEEEYRERRAHERRMEEQMEEQAYYEQYMELQCPQEPEPDHA